MAATVVKNVYISQGCEHLMPKKYNENVAKTSYTLSNFSMVFAIAFLCFWMFLVYKTVLLK